METTTYIKNVRLTDASQQQQIMELLSISELDYCQNQYDKGLAYALKQVDGDSYGFETLIRSKSFWSFWKNEWAKREANFLETFTNYSPDFLLEEYEFIHSYNGIRASKPIDQIENEFSYLWGKVWKEMRHV
jgi:hypothetical protein